MKNILLAQSGGPSAAINSTIAGAFERALCSGNIDRIYGAINGIKGVLAGRIIDLGPILNNTEALNLLCVTPAAALGSCRLKLGDPATEPEQYEQILEVFRRYNIGFFVYVGGNDSMDTVYKLSQYLIEHGVDDIKVMGAPKTIDNDLCEIDHSPGFGSAAKYIGTTLSEILCDVNVYDIPAVTIVEVMGRDAGWLAASSCLTRLGGSEGPQLIYLPEVPFSEERFIEDVTIELSKRPAVLVVASEGIRDQNGEYVGTSYKNGVVDVFGHQYLAGVGKYLESVVKEQIGCKVRSIELNLMQRCSAHLASATDLAESKMLGAAAVEKALEGVSGHMSTLIRTSNSPYTIKIDSVPIEKIANKEKTVPREWITERGNNVTNAMLTYLLPLIQGEVKLQHEHGLPVHLKLY